MRRRNVAERLLVLLVLSILFLGSACNFGPKADFIVIVDASGGVHSKGRALWTPGEEVDLWQPGGLFLFRAAQTLQPAGFEAKAGVIYEVKEGHKLTEVGTFNTSLSDQQLYARYLSTK